MTQKISLAKLKTALKANGMHLFPDETRVIGNLGVTVIPPAKNGKEYISGYYRAKMGNVAKEKEAFERRNHAAKLLREEGFQTWTEPRSHMGGTDTVEFYLTAMRKKS
jgi:hypothetical protein